MESVIRNTNYRAEFEAWARKLRTRAQNHGTLVSKQEILDYRQGLESLVGKEEAHRMLIQLVTDTLTDKELRLLAPHARVRCMRLSDAAVGLLMQRGIIDRPRP